MQKYFLYITGCDMNRSDAERVASVFNSHGFSLTSSEAEADIIIAFACSVREKAVHKVLGLGNKWQKMKPKPQTILTGCILEQDQKKFEEKFDFVFGIKEIQKLEEFLGGKVFVKDYLDIDPDYQSRHSVYVPIMTGCDNFCTYCAVPYTRGREVSRSEEDVLAEVHNLVNCGYKEITLLGQNVNSFGKIPNTQYPIPNQYPMTNIQDDIKVNSRFVNLLEKIDSIPGDYWVRFYSNHPKDMSMEIIDFLSTSKHFCHYIHLPLQSGDDDIIKKMNRHYTAKQYLELVKKIKKKIPDVNLTTDIIVGFPGETEEAFQNTVEVMRESGFDMAFMAEYSPRSGTIAAKMEDDVPHKEKERRKKFLNDEVLAKSVLENNQKLVGKNIRVLIYREDREGVLLGKTAGLKDVRITVPGREAPPLQIGDFANIKIMKANSWGMEGRVVE